MESLSQDQDHYLPKDEPASHLLQSAGSFESVTSDTSSRMPETSLSLSSLKEAASLPNLEGVPPRIESMQVSTSFDLPSPPSQKPHSPQAGMGLNISPRRQSSDVLSSLPAEPRQIATVTITAATPAVTHAKTHYMEPPAEAEPLSIDDGSQSSGEPSPMAILLSKPGFVLYYHHILWGGIVDLFLMCAILTISEVNVYIQPVSRDDILSENLVRACRPGFFVLHNGSILVYLDYMSDCNF